MQRTSFGLAMVMAKVLPDVEMNFMANTLTNKIVLLQPLS